MVQYKWFNTKLGPSEQIHHLNLDRGPRTEETIPIIIVRVMILNQEVTVRVINLNHSVRWVAVRVARPGILSKQGVNTSYLAQVLELNVV